MARIKIARLLETKAPVSDVLVKGWVRTRRDAKTFSFIEINDGSCLQNIQAIADSALENYESVKKLTVGSAVAVRGSLVASQGAGQKWELQAQSIDILSLAPESYPLQKKRHTDEFLRTIAHIRPRTNKYGATFRIRSALAFAIHRFFKERDFVYIHTPIVTGSDCEGAGELFQVTSLDLQNLPVDDGRVDYAKDFFGRIANLTVSGQLSAEMFALALGDVYSFGPTFRAENSNTRRHAAEFWMVEPEMAFLRSYMAPWTSAEEFIKLSGLRIDPWTNAKPGSWNCSQNIVDKTPPRVPSRTSHRPTHTWGCPTERRSPFCKNPPVTNPSSTPSPTAKTCKPNTNAI